MTCWPRCRPAAGAGSYLCFSFLFVICCATCPGLLKPGLSFCCDQWNMWSSWFHVFIADVVYTHCRDLEHVIRPNEIMKSIITWNNPITILIYGPLVFCSCIVCVCVCIYIWWFMYHIIYMNNVVWLIGLFTFFFWILITIFSSITLYLWTFWVKH